MIIGHGRVSFEKSYRDTISLILMDKCALNVTWNDTCYSLSQLREIAREYNRTHTEPIPLNSDPKTLVQKLQKRFHNVCGTDETCWLSFMKNGNRKRTIEREAFKLKIKQLAKLSSDDIEYVMEQYSKTVKSFAFLNAVPSNIYVPKVNKMYVKRLKTIPRHNRGTSHKEVPTMISIIFNTLPHGTIGEHWVALVIDRKSKTVEYFDPVGNEPNDDIERSIAMLTDTLGASTFRFLKNTIEHQGPDDDIDCGVYCIIFIVERMNGRSFHNIVENDIVADRERFFRTE